MKFVTTASTAISTGATQVADAVAKASASLQTELTQAIEDAGTAISTVTQQVGDVVTQLAGLPPRLDPQTLIGPLT